MFLSWQMCHGHIIFIVYIIATDSANVEYFHSE